MVHAAVCQKHQSRRPNPYPQSPAANPSSSSLARAGSSAESRRLLPPIPPPASGGSLAATWYAYSPVCLSRTLAQPVVRHSRHYVYDIAHAVTLHFWQLVATIVRESART